MEQYYVIAVVGGLVAFDTTVAGQFMISQPLISATLAGYLFGHPETGIFIGALMQLMWLKLIPAGGSAYLNGNLGTVAALSVFALSVHEIGASENALLLFALLYGMAASYVFGHLTVMQRNLNSYVIPFAHRAVDRGRIGTFQLIHISGALYTGLAGALLSILFAYTGYIIAINLPVQIYSWADPFAQYGFYAFCGTGIGVVLSMVWDRKAWFYPLIGIVCSTIIILIL